MFDVHCSCRLEEDCYVMCICAFASDCSLFSMLPTRCAAFLAFVAAASGHGIVSNPAAEFPPDVMRTTYVDRIDAFFPGKFDDSPESNLAAFNAAFKQQSQYKTLRDMLEPRGPPCGNTLTDVAKKPIPADGTMTWQNPDTGEGFVPSHKGPCEVWLDDKRVFQNDDCPGNYPQAPAATLKIDYSSCASSGCMLRFYWIALHEPKWQVYKNCVPLQGGSGAESPAMEPSENVGKPSGKSDSNGGKTGGNAKCSDMKRNSDYIGGDMSHHTVGGDESAQYSACCAACAGATGCAGFSLKEKVCYLKSSIGSPTSMNNRKAVKERYSVNLGNAELVTKKVRALGAVGSRVLTVDALELGQIRRYLVLNLLLFVGIAVHEQTKERADVELGSNQLAQRGLLGVVAAVELAVVKRHRMVPVEFIDVACWHIGVKTHLNDVHGGVRFGGRPQCARAVLKKVDRQVMLESKAKAEKVWNKHDLCKAKFVAEQVWTLASIRRGVVAVDALKPVHH
ncbi:hypothetical protein ACHHYP_20191 [Achlya hypogyna]|uniref:Apple domain-containing protein n=1 Tax=Achlya hypogyna TaxID=1202772 RepID=A0A1V9Z0N5_ACHHY|nr:hypothetical protein ACHHYP_20191 [Achlya hypogyna]